MAASILGPSRKGSPCIPSIAPGETKVLAEMEGPGIIRHIWITVTDKTSEQNCFVLRDLVLRMYWDDEENPSVESPLGDFFCCGFAKAYPVNSMPVAVNPTRGFNCYFPMPFGKKAKITIENQNTEAVPSFFYQVDYCLCDGLPENTGYFHAQWRRQRVTEKQKDYVILDGVKGGRPVCGDLYGIDDSGEILVGRRGSEILSGWGSGLPDDLRHRDRGLFRRSLEFCDAGRREDG